MSGQQTNINYGDSIEPIAIIGMACRFSGKVSSPVEFWDMLFNKRSGHCKVPSGRFDADAWQHPDHERRGAIQPESAFYLDDDISLFDAPFFSINAEEAMGIDPMQRHLLELAHECFENAGVPIEKLQGSMTSVYTGVMTNDYELVSATDIYNLAHNTAAGTSRAMLSNRLSWFFDLRGPSLTLDTACSSSLYALHLACQSIRLRESSQALVTGVNLILHPNFNSQLSAMHMLSPDGVSHSFDDRANGYGRGEAVGAILVKPLSQALVDGDTIRAIIRGTGANQDGKTPGITMPSSKAQADLIKKTYAAAGLPLANTSYFEAHGTGTKIGDPAELSAIGLCFASARSSNSPLYVGSVKTNVGHTEGAAGLAGVIKTVLSLENAVVPGIVGFERLNPQLLLDKWMLALPLETMKWPTGGLRRASINGFGFGGSNAHVILDDAYHYLMSRNLQGHHCTVEGDLRKENGYAALMQEAESTDSKDLPDYRLLAFSMQDQNGLKRLSKSVGDYLSANSVKGQQKPNLDDLAYTLANRRSQFSFRSFAVTQTIEELTEHEFKSIASTQQKRLRQSENLIFVFTGQGAQWPLMGRELLANPVFKASVHRSQQYLDEIGCKWNAEEILQDPGPRINIAEHCQPICTVLQVALVQMLEDWGIRPAAVVGHSSGEIAAAYAAGGISHKDAIKISYLRGYYCSLIQSRLKERRGAMLAAGLTAEEAHEYLEQVTKGSVVVGCVNSPTSVTLSGDLEGITYLEERIKLDGNFARKLRVEIAYHSPHMLAVAEDFLISLGKIDTATSFKVPMFSSLTTKRLEWPSDLDASYWVNSMSSSVRFSEAVKSLLDHTIAETIGSRKARLNWSAALEIGPHEALKGPFNQCLTAFDGYKPSSMIPYTSMVTRGEPASKSAREAAGLLWTLGYPVDIMKVNGYTKETKHKYATLTTLPPYPWQHSKGFWHEPAASASARTQSHPRTDLLGIAVDNQNAHEPRWRNYLRLAENPWIRDHAITGTILYPGAGMMIMAIEAALQLAEDKIQAVSGIELHDVHFDRGLVIPDTDEAVETSLSLKPHETLDSWFYWTVYSHPVGGSWTKHCYGLLTYVYDKKEYRNGTDSQSVPFDDEAMHWKSEKQRFESVIKSAGRMIDPPSFYSQLKSIGMGYGPAFANLTSAAFVEGDNVAHGTIAIPDTRAVMPHQYEFPHLIHPATLDAFFHLLFVALFEGEAMGEASIPMTLERLFVSTEQPEGPGSQFVALATAGKINDRDSIGSIVASDGALSGPKVIMSNVALRKVSSPAVASSGSVSLQETSIPKRVAQLQWKEDIDLLSRAAAENLIMRESVSARFGGLRTTTAQAAVWLERECHKNANLKVLAIVNNRSSHAIVDTLSIFGLNYGQAPRFDKCVVASTTKDLLRPLANNAKLQGLPIQLELINLENTISEQQSQERASFDVVLVGTETGDERIMEHITRRLAPEGKVLAVGSINRQVISGSDGKSEVEGGVWPNTHFDKVLAHTTPDTEQLVISTRSSKSQALNPTVVYVVERPDISAALITLKQNLAEMLSSKGITLESKLLNEVDTISGQTIICLLEAEKPLVINWTSEEFEQFRNLVYSQSYIMWVTRGGILGCHDNSLKFAPTTGLLRTIRVEVEQVVMPHIDISPLTSLAELSTSRMLIDAFEATSKPKSTNGKENDMELVESNGIFFIPRAVTNDAFDEELNSYSDSPVAIPGRLSGIQSPLVLVKNKSVGTSTEPYWAQGSDATTPLGKCEIEVKTVHLALSSVDYDSGTDIWQSSAARAASGTITRVGEDVTNFTAGDEIFFPILEGNSFKTRVRQHQSLVSKVQSSLSSQEAASIPIIFLTAYYCLADIARVIAGQRVLIHLVASGEREASVQIALALGAEVFVTTTGRVGKSLLVDRYNISEDRIFDSSSTALKENVTAVTEGKGFDAIISNHHGATLRQASLCLAELGHFVDTSRAVQVSDLSSECFRRNASFTTVNMQRLGTETIRDLFQKVVEMLKEGSITACTNATQVFSISSLDAVSKFLASNRGETAVLSFDDTSIVPILPTKPSVLNLSNTATYVLAGGLGALGLTIAENMVDHGAGHIVLISRSGVTNDRQRHILERLEKRGCAVDTVLCDVTEESQVARLVELSTENGWSIKGLIQCATVLKDSIFQKMTFDKWQSSTHPKIKGTWNLHQYLPDDLDFFVLLSSISGIIGNPAQSNYAAGNTYEDAVAHYRHARGLKATTLNIGLVADASHFTADSTVESYLKRFGHLAPALVTDNEMQIALKAAMRGTTGDGGAAPVQLLVGITDKVPRSNDGLNPWSRDRKFDHRAAQKLVLSASSGASARKSLSDELKDAKSGRDAVAAIEYALRTYVAAAMTASPEDIDAEKPLYSFGIDSLKAIQVRNWVSKELKCEVSVFDILSSTPVGQLASNLARKSSLISGDIVAAIDREGL